MEVQILKGILEKKFQNAMIEAVDLTGTGDHFGVHVSWDGFREKTLIEQHQMVNRALKDLIEDGRIHALKIKTVCP